MRPTIAIALFVFLLQGCVTTLPKTSDGLAATEREDVSRHRFEVPVPVATAYRNTLRKARECWQQATSAVPLLVTTTFIVEADPYDAGVGFARIAMRQGGRMVMAVVTLAPAGDAATRIEARAFVSPIGTSLGEADVPLMDKWALGQPVECQTKFLF